MSNDNVLKIIVSIYKNNKWEHRSLCAEWYTNKEFLSLEKLDADKFTDALDKKLVRFETAPDLNRIMAVTLCTNVNANPGFVGTYTLSGVVAEPLTDEGFYKTAYDLYLYSLEKFSNLWYYESGIITNVTQHKLH